jgi:hypothetical protein
MGKKGDFNYSYNGQISVDADRQIIVAQHLSLNANDKQEVEPALSALQDSTGRLPDQFSADNGYFSGDNLDALAQQRVDAYLAPGKGETTQLSPLDASERKLVKADFSYNETDDAYTCPGGQTLTVVRRSAEGQKVYQGQASVCAECPYFKRCCQSQKGEARTLSTDDQEPLRQQMREKMRQPAAKAVYRQRKVIVEPVGQIKNSGFRGFSVRGKAKVTGEFSLVCATHNLKKMVKAMGTGFVRPNFGKWALNPAT